jgi:hypothetical protein
MLKDGQQNKNTIKIVFSDFITKNMCLRNACKPSAEAGAARTTISLPSLQSKFRLRGS